MKGFLRMVGAFGVMFLIAAAASMVAPGTSAEARRRAYVPPAPVITPRSGLSGIFLESDPTAAGEQIRVTITVSDQVALSKLIAENGVDPNGTIPIRVWRVRGNVSDGAAYLCAAQTIGMYRQPGSPAFAVDLSRFTANDGVFFEASDAYGVTYERMDKAGKVLQRGELRIRDAGVTPSGWSGMKVDCSR